MTFKFLSNCVYVLELEKCDVQTPSPQRPPCLEDIRSQSYIPLSGDTSKIRHIQVVMYTCSEQNP
jgi:hypothetical protein